MPQSYKLKMKLPDELMESYGKSPSHMAALLKGARARQRGESRDSCPYVPDRAPGFYFAWSKGWIGMDKGTITLEDEKTQKITVYLEDKGQDFLEWDIEGGVVTACRPFQEWVWKGTLVHNTDIKPGDILIITPPKLKRTTLKYLVERVKAS